MILAIKQHVGGHFGIAGSFWAHPFRVPSLEALSGFSFAERETSLTHGGSLRSLQAKKGQKKINDDILATFCDRPWRF
jgi:hypothetical protein